MGLFLFCIFFLAVQADPRTHLHIGMFDWDDNLLKTPAFIYMQELVGTVWTPRSLTTAEFAAVQQLPDYSTNWRPSTTRDMYGDFTDQQGNDAFLDQVQDSKVSAPL
jgi:hypothetical protein